MAFKGMVVVLVDNDKETSSQVHRLCRDLELKFSSFSDSLQAMAFVMHQPIDLLIIKNKLEYYKGVDFVSEFKKKHKEIPVLMFKEESDRKNIYDEALKAGVDDFINKPFNNIEFKMRVGNLLTLRQKNILLEDRSKLVEEEIDEATSEVQENEYEILDILGKTTEYKDHSTFVHTSRVAEYSKILAEGYGLSQKKQDIIYHAAPLHDIGKVGIPDVLLHTPRALKGKEFEFMKKHTIIGYKILKDSKNSFLHDGAIIALTHHEKYDGSGYPRGLKGHHIPIEGRIVAIADVFDNLTSERPYKKAIEFSEAVEVIRSESGKHFDPELVDIFLKKINAIKSIFNSFEK
jgi:response regulator RpfG family c-di-GMP phosphodiesterase